MVWLFAIPATAAESDPATDITQLTNQLRGFENQFQNPELSESDLFQLIKTLDEFYSKIQPTIAGMETKTGKLSQQIASLGEAVADEPEDLKDKRKNLQNEKVKYEKWLAQYRLLLLQSGELLSATKNRLQTLLADRLLHKSFSIWQLTAYAFDHAADMASIYGDYFANQHGLNRITVTDYLILAFILSVSFAIGLWMRARLLRWCSTTQWGSQFIGTFFETFTISTACYLPYLLLSAVAAFVLNSFLSGIEPPPFIAVVGIALPVLLFSLYLIRLFLAPKLPARSFLPIPEKVGRRLGHKVAILALIGFTGYLLIGILYVQKAPQQFITFWRDVLVLLVVVNLIWIVVYSRNISLFAQKYMTRMLVVVTLLVLLALELFGYRNLVLVIARISASALAGFALVVILHHISEDFYDGLDGGVRQWHKTIRSKLGLKSRQPVPGLTFVRLVTLFALWGGFSLFLVSLLDFSGIIRQTITQVLTQGVNLGNLNINPTRILLAIIMFALLYTFSSWFKVQMQRQWLSKSRIDRGAKDALVTIIGYIGVAFAALIALSVAGVTFTNFAIIAGALSVGIGFGLQNIVNNFVSGLILLFERPIKNGDWIIVGSTEGHVKKISIRSTQIQTFDRADIIVPNSELVSSQVTNWMLHDKVGRIRIPVGVTYGSDTEKVRQLLHEVAMAHPHVIKDSTDYKISIFFLSFGDSSLDFELRCFIEDIDNALTVKSDLHFAIDKAFRENSVVIPFPQRDIHVKSNANKSSLQESN